MKKIILAFIGIALTLSSFGQFNLISGNLKSSGQHTATASGYQKWTWAKLGYDTLSTADTTFGIPTIGAKEYIPGAVQALWVADSVGPLNGNYKSGSILMTFKKVSGTTVDTAWLQGSVNGTNWVSLGQDTAKITNVTNIQCYTWELPGRLRPTNSVLAGANFASVNAQYYGLNQKPDELPYLYYRVFIRGKIGTAQAGIVKCWYVFRQGL